MLRLHAVGTEDRQLNTESGFPALVTFLRDRVVGRAGQLANRAASNDVVTITAQLAAGLRAELAACADPDQARQLVAELEQAKQRAADLRDRSARWHQVLNDGIADLNADVDYDLKDRMRAIVREGEVLLDGTDPAKAWDQLAQQVEDQAAAAAAANFVWASERARWLAGQVAELFAEDGARSLPRLPTSSGPRLPDLIGEMETPGGEKFGAGQGCSSGCAVVTWAP